MRAASPFSYAVYRLVPRIERGERINAGVVVFCRPLGYLGAKTELDEARALALWPDSELALAEALVATGRGEQARKHFNAAIDLSKDANFDKQIAIAEGTETGDYAAAIAALRNPQLQMPEETRAALLSGYQALASGGPQAKTKAITLLISLPADKRSNTVATLLAALGANHQALQVASQRPTLFWRRSMRRVLDDPAFPTVANQLGLIAYWKTTRTRPDVCWSTDPPPFCQMV